MAGNVCETGGRKGNTFSNIWENVYIKKKFLKGVWIHLSVSELFVQKIVPILQNA